MSKTTYETNFEIIDKTENYKKYISPLEYLASAEISSDESVTFKHNKNIINVIFNIDVFYLYGGCSYHIIFDDIFIPTNCDSLLKADILKYIKKDYFDKSVFDDLEVLDSDDE